MPSSEPEGLKKKYIYSSTYVEPQKRKNVALRWLLHFLDNFSSYNFKNRLFLLFSDLIFNFKGSFIYSRKVKMYKKMFKI